MFTQFKYRYVEGFGVYCPAVSCSVVVDHIAEIREEFLYYQGVQVGMVVAMFFVCCAYCFIQILNCLCVKGKERSV